MDFLFSLLRGLIPPHGGDPKLDYRWRINVAVVCVAAVMAIALGAALYMDLVPFMPGLARTDQLRATDKELEQNGQRDVRMHVESIVSTLENLCALARQAKEPELKQAYLQRIDYYMERYEHFTKHPYALPACGGL